MSDVLNKYRYLLRTANGTYVTMPMTPWSFHQLLDNGHTIEARDETDHKAHKECLYLWGVRAEQVIAYKELL